MTATLPAPSHPAARRFAGSAVALLLVAALHAGRAHADLLADLPVGEGFAASELCTRVMVSGDDYARVLNDYTVPIVQPLPAFWSVDFRAAQYADVSAALGPVSLSRRAIFRNGRGCTIVAPGTDEASLRAQPFTPDQTLPNPFYRWLPWPLGDATPHLLSRGGNRDHDRGNARAARLLQQQADALFAEPDLAARQQTIAVLVAQDGRLIYERYAPGYSPQQPQLGWSMTKSLTGLTAGLLAADHRLDLDAPVLQRFVGTDKAGITWRHLLHMASGLQWDEGYAGASDATQALFSEADQGAYTAAKPLVATPGSVFNYSTGAANLAMLGLRELLGGSPAPSSQAIHDLVQQRLFRPLGIRNGLVEPDASGTPVGGSRGVLRPRDWLRLGQLVLDEGRWAHRQLLPREWLHFLLTPSPANPGYGGFVWLGAPDTLPAELRERVPHDVVWFAGHLGQYVLIVPSRRLVVLRMGVSLDADETERRVFEATSALAAGLKPRGAGQP